MNGVRSVNVNGDTNGVRSVNGAVNGVRSVFRFDIEGQMRRAGDGELVAS